MPKAHPLESWGDGLAMDGTVTLFQPLIEPVHNGRTEAEFLAAFIAEGDKGARSMFESFWRKQLLAQGKATELDFQTKWEHWLGRGFIEGTASAPEATTLRDASTLAASLSAFKPEASAGGIELDLAVCSKMFDGSSANNAWLQELPDPITKITWDNAVILSKTTAKSLGVETGDKVSLSKAGVSVTGPVYVQPGHADNTATVALGYGRTEAGQHGTGVGFDVSPLRDANSPWFVSGVEIKKVWGSQKFGITQDHWSMEGRDPVLAGTLHDLHDHHSKLSEGLHHGTMEQPYIHDPHDYSKTDYAWGMVIDLNTCNGCGNCVVSCQAENNLPVVGREEVDVGREMHWLRVDRYYEGDDDDDKTQVVTQPVGCVHCEAAPCEYVCPVNATAHSDEGTNDMVYNRCIGTRYCANNCPYKARRFNFLDYHGDPTPLKKMMMNPDVTVRSRGVMEKCTYCIQRIARKRIDARVDGRKLVDGEVTTACQDGCPTRAITFGSINDPDSQVTQLKNDPRRYDLLHELGTRPRTSFLARIRNPNPELA